MKLKILLLAGLVSLGLIPAVSAQQIGQLTTGLNNFANNSVKSLPFAASAGMDWSDAYIGQIIDTDFPFVHFGVGGAVGLTTLPTDAFSTLLTTFGEPAPSVMAIPFTVVNGRIGGFFLPFDIGFKVGYIPNISVSMAQNFSFTYENLGFDIRYDLLKADLVLPKVSVGFGINYLDATAGTTLGADRTFTDAAGNTLSVGAPRASLEMSTVEYEIKGQVSKSFIFVTPYLGGAVSFASATAKAGINSSGVTTNAPGGVGYWTQYGIGSISDQGFNTSNTQGVFGLKVYGGSSLDIFFLKVDLQVMYSLLSGDWGGSLGARIQL